MRFRRSPVATPFRQALLRTDIGYYDLKASGELVTSLVRTHLVQRHALPLFPTHEAFQCARWLSCPPLQSRGLQLARAGRHRRPALMRLATSLSLSLAQSGDILLIQGAVGEKMGGALQNFSTFISGLLVGFVRGWKLTLVILACVPVLAVSGAVTASLLTSMSSQETKAYAKAGSVANEIFSTFRTVAAFNGEARAQRAYAGALGDTLRLGIRQKAVSGLGTGAVSVGMYGTFALCLWYATVLIRSGAMSGGTALNVFFAVLMGGSALGQARPPRARTLFRTLLPI